MRKQVWQQDLATVMADLKTNPNGLKPAEVAQRQTQYGLNKLETKGHTTLLQKFINQFKDLMIIILLVAALISVFVGEGVDALIILLVVILNAIFGVFQESKAEEAIDALQKLSAPMANVKRNGQLEKVPSSQLVPGDIVLLEAGDIVPADLRLIAVSSLKIEESALTGESLPVNKQTAVIVEDKVPLGDRKNLAFMNSSVTAGRGEGVIIATGMQTEVGKIAHMINTADENITPLQKNLAKLSKVLTGLILVIAVFIFIVGMLRGTESIIDMLLTAISLAVAAIPEGLPAIVTITLALGTQRMAKRHAIIRKLPAVETLGSTQIIASDKTGTLTQNKMTVEKIFANNQLQDISHLQDFNQQIISKLMILNNDTKMMKDELMGDPTETALIAFNQKQKINVKNVMQQYPRVGEVPFDSERKLMSTINKMADGRYLITVKGAPDELLKKVSQYRLNNNVLPMSENILRDIKQTNHKLATQAIRVLGFAYRIVTEMPTNITSSNVEHDLIFAGLVGMIDPERPEVKAAIKEAHDAGIRTLMITGDHKDTAGAIAQRLGMIEESDVDTAVITGAQLDEQTDEQLARNVEKYAVYARVAPEHKVRIVNAWQKKNKVVAMTGDGVNDAPSLKQADIGIAMGITGTEVSKNASDLILADDNFATIVDAVKEGRKVFANIQKAIQYLLSANLGEVLTLFVMTMIGWQILAPVHILWINLVTDTLPAIALGLEPAEGDVMQQKPRGHQASFLSDGVGFNIIYQGLLEGGITLLVYWLGLTFPVHANNQLMHADALTMAFATLGLIQLFHAFNAKSIHGTILHRLTFQNKFFNWSILISFILLASTILLPGLNEMFHVSALDVYQWLIVLIAASSIIVIVELVKLITRKIKS